MSIRDRREQCLASCRADHDRDAGRRRFGDAGDLSRPRPGRRCDPARSRGGRGGDRWRSRLDGLERRQRSWQSSLRTEVKRSAAAMNDVQELYQTDLPTATEILRAQILPQSCRPPNRVRARPSTRHSRSGRRSEPARARPLAWLRPCRQLDLRPAVGRLRPGQTPERHPDPERPAAGPGSGRPASDR